MIKFLHVYNNGNVIKKCFLKIDNKEIKVTLRAKQWVTNLSLPIEAVVKVIEADNDIEIEESFIKKYHPTQDDFDKRYNIKHEKIDGEYIYYSLINKSEKPKKLLITFPGISNFDNASYRLSALTSFQSVLCSDVAIIAFQDRNEVYGNYMYKTLSGVKYEKLITKFIKVLQKKFLLDESDLIFYGNSKGGSICFDYVNNFPNAYFFIDIPQLDLYNYKSQNELLRFSLGDECRRYHNHLETIKKIKSKKVSYSLAELDYDAHRGLYPVDIPGIEVNMLKNSVHSGAAIELTLRQMSRISILAGISKSVIRPELQDFLKIIIAEKKMYFRRRLGAFKKNSLLKDIYAEIRFEFLERETINVSLEKRFDGKTVIVEWSEGLDLDKILSPIVAFKSYLVVYYRFKEFIYPLKTPKIFMS